MGIFFSPKVLINLLKNKDSIANELNSYYTEWYFTKEGENAYKNAKNQAQKTAYFFNYLSTLDNSRGNRDVLYRTAYVMASSMDNSSLNFAGYPNILNPDKNPLVNYIKNFDLGSKEMHFHGIIMLSELHNENDAKKYVFPKNKPYERLTYRDDDGNMDDMYKIERDIIGAFCIDCSEQYMPPFVYNIVLSQNDGNASDDDELEDDEFEDDDDELEDDDEFED